MQVPVRLFQAVRPNEHPGKLLSTAYGTAVLSVGPFLLPAVADHYGIGLGTASLSTAIQLGGFVVGSWAAGRYLVPRGRLLGIVLFASLLINAVCAFLPPYVLLVGLRGLNGVALGVITWFSWSQVFGDSQRMSEIAVVGPLVGVTTAPIAAIIINQFGPEGIYIALAITALVPLVFTRNSGRQTRAFFVRKTAEHVERHAPTMAAKRTLAALGLVTLGGSSVFTFGSVIALSRTELSAETVALCFSANAVAGIPSARWPGHRGNAGVWLAVCGLAAITMGITEIGAVFAVAMAAWGFAFWMGIPAAYVVLANNSAYPEERAGDAQAVMATGRVVGPLVGGALLDATGAVTLGLLGGSIMLIGAIALMSVARATPSVNT